MDKVKIVEVVEFIELLLDEIRVILEKYDNEKIILDKKIQLAALERKIEEVIESAVKINQKLIYNFWSLFV